MYEFYYYRSCSKYVQCSRFREKAEAINTACCLVNHFPITSPGCRILEDIRSSKPVNIIFFGHFVMLMFRLLKCRGLG